MPRRQIDKTEAQSEKQRGQRDKLMAAVGEKSLGVKRIRCRAFEYGVHREQDVGNRKLR